jgi:hypothetical protein
MNNIAKAILAVMKDVKGIDKTMTVGSGSNSYKGVPDQEVKKIIGESMQRNGLTILPTGVEAKTQVDRWSELDSYSKVPGATKQKQSVFTEVNTKYLLLHESGESIELSGYGHGVDSQDKGAGKATTYALKYTLLYTFLVPTGKIDDSDNDHSDNKEVPQSKQAPTPVAKQPTKQELKPSHPKWNDAIKALSEEKTTIEKIQKAYSLSEENKQLLLNEILVNN